MRSRWIVALVAACGDDGNTQVDAPPIDSEPQMDAPLPCNVDAPFGAPTTIMGLTGTGVSATYGGHLSADRLRMYVTRGMPGTATQAMFVATRPTADGFFTVAPLSIMNPGNMPMAWPMLSEDELTIYFQTTSTIMTATRAALTDTFPTAVALADLGAGGAGMTPRLSRDGLSLHFGRIVSGNAGLFVATRAATTDAFGAGTMIAELASDGYEEGPVVSDDGLEMLFMRVPNGSAGAVYRATRTSASGAFGTPVAVAELGTGNLSPSWISPDRCQLLFSRLDGASPQIFLATRPQ
ncbi:MAG: hypothetical protein ACKV2T_26720 [Kofleriaceae bacterium]